MAPTNSQKRRLVKFFDQSIRQHPSWPVIISEGDSWYSFPFHSNIIDFLDSDARGRISLLRLERNGDELLSILSGRQRVKLRRFLDRYPVQALLLSGGGNDIAGPDLLHLLKDKSDGMSWEDCLRRDRIERRLQQLKLAYLDVIDIRDDVRPECVIYVHGYDHAIPSGKGVKIFDLRFGPWLKPNLEARGIHDPSDQQKIIKWLIDAFNKMLQEVGRQNQRFTYLDTRGTVSPGNWNDELHPRRQGFRAIATIFGQELNQQFPATF